MSKLGLQEHIAAPSPRRVGDDAQVTAVLYRGEVLDGNAAFDAIVGGAPPDTVAGWPVRQLRHSLWRPFVFTTHFQALHHPHRAVTPSTK